MTNGSSSLDLILSDARLALVQLTGTDSWKHVLTGVSQGTGRGADHAALSVCTERHDLAIISFPHRLVTHPDLPDNSRHLRVFPRHRVIVASAAHLTGPVVGLEEHMHDEPIQARQDLVLMIPDPASPSGLHEIRIAGAATGDVARAVAELHALKA